MDRDTLEKQALLTVSPDLYYELADTISEASDSELHRLIACNGNYDQELLINVPY